MDDTALGRTLVQEVEGPGQSPVRIAGGLGRIDAIQAFQQSGPVGAEQIGNADNRIVHQEYEGGIRIRFQ